jgi:hypothetical protein
MACRSYLTSCTETRDAQPSETNHEYFPLSLPYNSVQDVSCFRLNDLAWLHRWNACTCRLQENSTIELEERSAAKESGSIEKFLKFGMFGKACKGIASWRKNQGGRIRQGTKFYKVTILKLEQSYQ